jgi:light-regulated signal transduction histidine kinase (bacteriophytochrome)
VIGILALTRFGSAQPSFDDQDLSLAQDLADRAALAIDNARLLVQLQHELDERSRAEAEVRTLNDELERRVAERTAELTVVNQDLEAFSYSISHDLRAPLRAIDGFSRILQEDFGAELPEEAQHHIQVVRDNTHEMGHLIDDLLAFARLGRQSIARRSIAPGKLVRQCLNELRGELEGRRVDLRLGELPDCWGDAALLKQVWMNLLTNAFKYTRTRDPAVIEVGSQRENTETIYFVKDNGVGFDMHFAYKLFAVFQRLHRAEEYEGTGVGLAIAQRIVDRHGGRIWADAAVNQGAAFYFTLGGDLL